VAATLVTLVVGFGGSERQVSERVWPSHSRGGEVGFGSDTRSETRKPRCLIVRLRASIGHRRIATWHWLDVLGLPREPTRYRERETHGCPYLRFLRALWAARADATWRLYVKLREPEAAIRHVFGPRYAGEALAVARCESGLSRNARNGQFRGLFQLGSWERRRYGHGDTALEQARAAWRYFVASGRDWRPWSCRWAAR
jgi:hypothetical protein